VLKEVRLVSRHAFVKTFPLLKSMSGKLVSPLACHALVKFTLLALVPSFAPAGNDVRAEQDFHAFVKVVPLEASMAPNELSELLPSQAFKKFVQFGA
jgi:hypothetical protein